MTKVHLVSARWTNHPWGFGNHIYDALLGIGCEVIDTDFRRSRSELPSLLSQPCDLLLVFKGEGISPGDIMASPGKSVLWYPDDLIATTHGKAHIAYNGWAFDIVYHISPWDACEYTKRGVRDLRWLPLACNPKLHRRLARRKHYRRKLYDVLFVGSAHPERVKLYERLRQSFHVTWRSVYHEQMVQAINRARIVINLPIGGFKSGNIPNRIFEVLACGTLLLTNELPDDSELFLGGKHLIYYNEKNIEDLIAYFLEHEEEREEIAEAGRKEVLDKHTVVHRVERILADTVVRRLEE